MGRLPFLATVALLASAPLAHTQDAPDPDAEVAGSQESRADPEAERASEEQRDAFDSADVLEVPKRRHRYEIGPAGDVFPRSIADPRRSVTGLQLAKFNDSSVGGVGDLRWLLRVGERIGLVRATLPGKPRAASQVDMEVGILAQFDLENDADNVGWDGFYAFSWSYTPNGRFALRGGLHHDSSHIGDEFIENTGAKRANYTREEVFFGLSQKLGENWRTYGELGYQWHEPVQKAQEPLRLQWGLELRPPPMWWKGRLGWYVATDASTFEENDFDLNVSLQAGFAMKFGERRLFRFGVQAYDGRSPIGEFFQERQSYVSIGVWFDQ